MAENSNRGARPQRNYSTIGETREAWATVQRNDFICYRSPPEHTSESGEYTELTHPEVDLDSIWLTITYLNSKKTVNLKLTGLTTSELMAVRDAINYAIDAAEPIVKELDERAVRAARQGVDTHARLYRRDGQFIVRKRDVSEHDQGLRRRLAGVGDVAGEPTANGATGEGVPQSPAGEQHGPQDGGTQGERTPDVGA